MMFNKFFANKEYAIMFNTKTGFEVIQGINGKDDPFSLELPSLLDVGIMGHCVHSCPFCYQGHAEEPNMTLHNFKVIVDATKHHVNQIALGGRGDPNHHENFAEIVEYTRKNGMVPNYTTSGIDLTDEQIEISKLCGAVAVSDYGHPYTYEAINRFIDAGIKTNIHMIYSGKSHAKAIQIILGIDVWKNSFDVEKLNAVIFLLFKPAGAGADLKWSPVKEQFNTFANIVFAPKSKFKIGMDSCLINHILQYSQPNELQRMSIDSCEGGRMSAYITPDMRMMPCSFSDKDKWAVPINNALDIKWAWDNSKPFTTFRNILTKNQCSCPLTL